LFQILLRKPNKLKKNERKITKFDEKSKSILALTTTLPGITKRKQFDVPAVGVRRGWWRSR
jgi:hypothetical protein